MEEKCSKNTVLIRWVNRRIKKREQKAREDTRHVLLTESSLTQLLILKRLRKSLKKPAEPSLKPGERDWDMDD